MDNKTIEQVQAEAIKQGHCHCNLGLKCPCEAYKKTGVCMCFNKYIDNEKEKPTQSGSFNY
jgi:hypothetical protein